MVGARVTVAPDVSGKPTVTLWFDHLSGDSDTTDADPQAFNTLFATNHKFYGNYDAMLFAVAGPGDGQGLQDIALKGTVAPGKVKLAVDAHVFLAASPIDDAMLGQEVDVRVGIPIVDHLALGTGGAVLAANGTLGVWSWLQLDATL
jgi:hypothetical protein